MSEIPNNITENEETIILAESDIALETGFTQHTINILIQNGINSDSYSKHHRPNRFTSSKFTPKTTPPSVPEYMLNA